MKLKIKVKRNIWAFFPLLFIGCCVGCSPKADKDELPVMGIKTINEGDTIYHTIPDFSFIDQDSNLLDQSFLEGKVYVTDFFFTSCPSICPRMKAQMLRVSEAFGDRSDFALLSHSIDPEYDTPIVLKTYASKLQGVSPNWRFLTGKKSEIYEIANDYLVSVAEDPDAPGGVYPWRTFYSH